MSESQINYIMVPKFLFTCGTLAKLPAPAVKMLLILCYVGEVLERPSYAITAEEIRNEYGQITDWGVRISLDNLKHHNLIDFDLKDDFIEIQLTCAAKDD